MIPDKVRQTVVFRKAVEKVRQIHNHIGCLFLLATVAENHWTVLQRLCRSVLLLDQAHAPVLDACQMLFYHIFARSIGMLNCKLEIVTKVELVFLHIRFGNGFLRFQEGQKTSGL